MAEKRRCTSLQPLFFCFRLFFFPFFFPPLGITPAADTFAAVRVFALPATAAEAPDKSRDALPQGGSRVRLDHVGFGLVMVSKRMRRQCSFGLRTSCPHAYVFLILPFFLSVCRVKMANVSEPDLGIPCL